MARGQAGAANSQLKFTNATGAQQEQRANSLEDSLVPGYTSMMDTGYLNPQEEAAATTNEMGAATAPFGAAKFNANNTAAATRNGAGQEANADQLAMDEGRTAGNAAATLQNQKMANQEQGMYGLSNLEAGNLQSADQMYGLGPGTLNARAAGQSGDQMAQGYLTLGLGTKAGSKI